MHQARQAVLQGGSLATAVTDRTCFAPMLPRMISVGGLIEETQADIRQGVPLLKELSINPKAANPRGTLDTYAPEDLLPGPVPAGQRPNAPAK